MAKKEYVWLVRYGKTEYPLKENDGPYNSDIHPIEGVHHAQCIADKISSSNDTSSLPTTIYSSPFLRCVHTASIIATKLGNNTKINVEEGLYEWLVPSLLVVQTTNVRTYPNSLTELEERFTSDVINCDYKSLNPYSIDESNQKFCFPENESQLLNRCEETLELILKENNNTKYDDDNKGRNIIIVAHAPCVQSIAFAMEEGVYDVKNSKLDKWPLGGITRFSRDILPDNESFGKWEMDFYGVTDHMPGEYRDGAGLWSLSCFDK